MHCMHNFVFIYFPIAKPMMVPKPNAYFTQLTGRPTQITNSRTLRAFRWCITASQLFPHGDVVLSFLSNHWLENIDTAPQKNFFFTKLVNWNIKTRCMAKLCCWLGDAGRKCWFSGWNNWKNIYRSSTASQIILFDYVWLRFRRTLDNRPITATLMDRTL